MSPNRLKHRAEHERLKALGLAKDIPKIENREEWHAPADPDRQFGNQGIQNGFRRSIALELGIKRNTTEDRAWRMNVLDKDNHTCVHCGSNENLEVDHIKPLFLYPDLRFNLDNGRTLCHNCHVQTPTYGTKVKQVVSVHVD